MPAYQAWGSEIKLQYHQNNKIKNKTILTKEILSLFVRFCELFTLVSLDSQSHLLNSGSPPGSTWVSSLCATSWKSSQASRRGQSQGYFICIFISGITVLLFIVSSVLKTDFGFFFFFLIVTVVRINGFLWLHVGPSLIFYQAWIIL
jgi:hypothetical protein